jgi:hypothetical protein
VLCGRNGAYRVELFIYFSVKNHTSDPAPAVGAEKIADFPAHYIELTLRVHETITMPTSYNREPRSGMDDTRRRTNAARIERLKT